MAVPLRKQVRFDQDLFDILRLTDWTVHLDSTGFILYYSSTELKTWIDEGKLGNISDNDFNALWSALDLDGSGTVDFVEFCTFLSGCGEAFDEVYDQQEKMSKHEKMKYASSRLLKSAPSDDEKDIEKDIKD
jgi:hypothetical protein